ncbi:MAG: hypothetical protein HDT46_10765 [Ruminococcaceae bacterium]|nr:hypothetical protein [Oscillospiraceae bacterium]MBD5116018.1 hypothetical protein [Oscillospiraceae bacterium]
MIIFFLVLLVVSLMALAAEMILRSAYKIDNFGVDKYWLDFHGKTIPFEDFFPHNVFELLIFILAFSAFGLILSGASMPAAGSVFCGLIFGSLAIYSKKHLFFNIYVRAKREKLPKNRPDADDKAVCREEILDGGYGSIEFVYKGRKYILPAMSANETDIEAGEEVTVVHREEEICWVEKINEELREVEED